MSLGYDKQLFILAFDHRGSFKKKFGVTGDPTPDEYARLRDAKKLVWEGFLKANEGGLPEGAGVLADEEMGEDVVRAAKEMGVPFAMPAEKSGMNTFDFEYGDDFGKHIEAYDPTWCKVLVRWNPGDSDEDKDYSATRLKRLGEWLHANDRKFLFELLVPANDADMASVDGDQRRYDTEVRPDLTIASIEEILGRGIEVDIWKIEGLDKREDCERLDTTIRQGGRDGVIAVVLGRGADDSAVDHWLEMGAPVPAYQGFAIGRSIWSPGVEAYVANEMSREEATADIAARFKRFIDVYQAAEA